MTKSLVQMLYKLTKSTKATVNILAFIFLPGTLIHELAHVLTAGVLLVPVGNFEIMPQIMADGVKLGSAQIGRTDPFRRVLIGVAPVIVGIVVIIGSIFYLYNNDVPLWVLVALSYIVFEAANTMVSSKKDLEGTLEVAVIVVGFFAACYLLKFTFVFEWMGGMLARYGPLLQTVDLYMLVPIVLDIVVFVLSLLLTRFLLLKPPGQG